MNSDLQSESLGSGYLEKMEKLWVDSLEHVGYTREVVRGETIPPDPTKPAFHRPPASSPAGDPSRILNLIHYG